MMIGGNIYKNKDGKLPDAYGRIWYEADISYTSGFRNDARILYSNECLTEFKHYDDDAFTDDIRISIIDGNTERIL